MEEKMGVIKKFQALSSTNDVLAVCNAKPPSPPLRKHPPKRVLEMEPVWRLYGKLQGQFCPENSILSSSKACAHSVGVGLAKNNSFGSFWMGN